MLAGAFSFISDLTEKLGDWASNWWFLAVIFVIAFLDSVVPIVPSETTVIIGGVACSTGEAKYSLIMVIACGAVGAFLGDNTAYSIGHRFSPWFERRAQQREKTRARLAWARRALEFDIQAAVAISRYRKCQIVAARAQALSFHGCALARAAHGCVWDGVQQAQQRLALGCQV